MLDSIISQLQKSYVTFVVSDHMLKNSEMNATNPIREFLRNESIFDFSTLPDATMDYLECMIIHNNEKHTRRVRVGYPPNKREARFWIYGLKDFVEQNEEILMSIVGDNLIIIPLNQIDFTSNIIEILSQVRLNEDSVAVIVEHEASTIYRAYKTNYIKKAEDNAKLGLEGELFVYALEKQRLKDLELDELVGRVQHKSVTEGDGLGYDILSFDHLGNELHIEVKTTKYECQTRFYISQNELSFSRDNPGSYCLYRVYNFDESTKMGRLVTKKGNIEEHVELIATNYYGILDNSI